MLQIGGDVIDGDQIPVGLGQRQLLNTVAVLVTDVCRGSGRRHHHGVQGRRAFDNSAHIDPDNDHTDDDQCQEHQKKPADDTADDASGSAPGFSARSVHIFTDLTVIMEEEYHDTRVTKSAKSCLHEFG